MPPLVRPPVHTSLRPVVALHGLLWSPVISADHLRNQHRQSCSSKGPHPAAKDLRMALATGE
eukprot:4530783-Alexandrium_andersonii.AAC.1